MGGEIKGNEDRESVRSKSTKNFEWKSTTNGEKREEKREKNIGRISAFFALRIGGKTANSEDKNESKEKKIDRSTSHESFVSSQRNTGLWWSIAFERRTDVLWKEAGVVPRDPFINPPVGARLPRGTHEAITPSDNSRSSIVRHRGRVRERASFSRLKKKGTYGSVWRDCTVPEVVTLADGDWLKVRATLVSATSHVPVTYSRSRSSALYTRPSSGFFRLLRKQSPKQAHRSRSLLLPYPTAKRRSLPPFPFLLFPPFASSSLFLSPSLLRLSLYFPLYIQFLFPSLFAISLFHFPPSSPLSVRWSVQRCSGTGERFPEQGARFIKRPMGRREPRLFRWSLFFSERRQRIDAFNELSLPRVTPLLDIVNKAPRSTEWIDKTGRANFSFFFFFFFSFSSSSSSSYRFSLQEENVKFPEL